jgi:hypothetical protein
MYVPKDDAGFVERNDNETTFMIRGKRVSKKSVKLWYDYIILIQEYAHVSSFHIKTWRSCTFTGYKSLVVQHVYSRYVPCVLHYCCLAV